MAPIRLTPEAAWAIKAQLHDSKVGLEAGSCDFFAGHASQSRMMSEFEGRVEDVLRLIKRYQELLERDINSLDQACLSIVVSDSSMAAAMARTVAHVTSPKRADASNGGGGGVR